MKKIIVLLLLAVGVSAFQCEDEQECAKLDWLQEIIEGAKQSPHQSEVIRYKYKLQTVYYINTCIECADSMSQLYTCSGEVICQFGGIAGLNTCPDFEEKATNRKVIWKN